MSIRKHLLNLHLFLQREFVSNSKEYFEKRFFKAYNLISFKEEEMVYTNEFDIKLNSFFNQYPFMNDFLSYRNKVKSLEDYCNLCFNVINEHFIQVKKDNTLYSNDLLQNKDETVAYNIVKHERNDFFNKIRTIFYIIEKRYSLELIKENTGVKKRNFKSGPNNNELKKIALKYFLIQHFYKEERLKTIKYKNQTDFLEKIGRIEGVVPGSLKTHYAPIKYNNLNEVFKRNKMFFKEMLVDNVFENHYNKCIKYIEENINN